MKDYLRGCLYLIFDSASFYWKDDEKAKNIIRSILEQ